jgi:enamine deaminase RidA (YjgF/YER057c/UK114 family)
MNHATPMTYRRRTLPCAVSAALLLAALVSASARADAPLIERMNPAGLSKPAGYSQVVTSRGGRTVYVSGQGGIGADGKVPEDLAEQTRLMFDKIRLALAAAGAAPRDVVRMTVYIVDLGRIDPNPVYQGIRDFFPADGKPTSTVVGVSALALPGMKVEIEVVAAVAD